MNKEEIKIKVITKDCVYSEDGITYMSDRQYNNYINIIEQLEQENQKYKEIIEKAIKFIDEYMYDDYGYVGNEDILKDILKEVE